MSGMARELRYFGYFNTMFWVCAGVIDRLSEGYAGKEEIPEYNQYRRSSQEIVYSDK
jgi:hypothetical protein